MRILLLIASVALAACQSADARPDGKTGASAAAVAHSPGKRQHPIQVSVTVERTLRAGVETGAELIVTSSRPARDLEVVLQPEAGMTVSENRFLRGNGDLAAGREVSLPFRFVPSRDDAQPLTVVVRMTDSAGRVLTREVSVSLTHEPKDDERDRLKNLRAPAENAPEPEGDALLPAEQEIIRN